MENSELISGSDITRAAEAIHNAGRERGWFQSEWSAVPKEGKERYEVLALAALATHTPAKRVTVEEVAEVDVRLLDDAITLITKSLASMLTDTSFASPYYDDHRPRVPKWVMTHFIHDHDRRVAYVNDIKQRLDWIRNATEKVRLKHYAALKAKHPQLFKE